MARGWESKSVEMQMDERHTATPATGANAHPNAQHERALEVLELSRKHLIDELRTIANPRLRAIKERALAHIERQIEASR
jgi:hypothetical protein